MTNEPDYITQYLRRWGRRLITDRAMNAILNETIDEAYARYQQSGGIPTELQCHFRTEDGTAQVDFRIENTPQHAVQIQALGWRAANMTRPRELTCAFLTMPTKAIYLKDVPEADIPQMSDQLFEQEHTINTITVFGQSIDGRRAWAVIPFDDEGEIIAGLQDKRFCYEPDDDERSAAPMLANFLRGYIAYIVDGAGGGISG